MTPSSRPTLDELAAAEIDDTDVELLDSLARGYTETDPVPTGLADRIRFGITLDALDAEVAELQRSADLIGVRGEAADADTQTVTFTSTRLTTMVTTSRLSADRVRVDGWVAPGGGVLVELRLPDQTLSTTADADGRFVFADVQRGLAKFVLRPPGGDPPVYTPSIEI